MSAGHMDRYKQQMRRIIEVFTSGNLAEFRELVGDTYIDHQAKRDPERNGPDGFRCAVEAVSAFQASSLRI
jgi:hypothetical protein